MKKKGFIVIMAVFFVMQGCSFSGMTEGSDSAHGGQVELAYYSKDATGSFLAFLQNPKPASPARSVSEPGGPAEAADSDVFAGLWASLSEEEKELVLANPQAVQIELEESIGISVDSELGRAVAARNAGVISELTGRFRFMAQLKDWFQDKEVPYNYAGIESGIAEAVPANMAVQKLLMEDDLEGVAAILGYFDMADKFDELKAGWEAVTATATAEGSAAGQRSVARSSGGGSGAAYSSVLYTNLGATLQDGDVLVMSRTGTAYVFGTYNHAGIFSKKAYKNRENDGTLCVYTAQPEDALEYSSNVRPDRPGYACLDNIFIYTLQNKAAVIRPINYTAAKAEAAVKYAKEVFYDRRAVYYFPLWEIVVFDTSHGDAKQAYCSKVVWHAWKSVGVDLDADNAYGNMIAPDELYDSSISRYNSGSIKLFGITIASWCNQTYAATSNIIRRMSR